MKHPPLGPGGEDITWPDQVAPRGRRTPSTQKFKILCSPLPPHSPRCVWLVNPSGCPLSSPASTSFHAVCAFRRLGPVAPQVRPACPLRVCVFALPWRPRSPPLPRSVWCAHSGSGAGRR